jgi:pilus assembly protein CpaE
MRSFVVITESEARSAWGQALLAQSQTASPLLLTATPAGAAILLAEKQISPSHIVIDIGMRGADILAEIDALAQQCEPGTRVVAVGDTNDIQLYRELIGRGVLDYFPMPADNARVIAALTVAPPSKAPVQSAPIAVSASGTDKRVIVFMSAASGDGASTAALNCAYTLSQIHNGKTVLVDMDYQFGMVAKHLGLQNQYGIRDLFEHPDRGVDATLIKHMVASYGKLHVITAPSELRYLPNVSAESIRDLITTLKQTYDYVVVDLPHVWLPWVATAAQQSTHLVLVAQLWLKSVSHASRLVRAFREQLIPIDRVVPVINRSGAKFKEAIQTKDFERVCGASIRYTLSNDIKSIVEAEASATTVMQLQPSVLSADIQTLARGLSGLPPLSGAATEKRAGLFSLLKG